MDEEVASGGNGKEVALTGLMPAGAQNLQDVCGCYTVAHSQLNVKLKKKNKNQVIKLYTHGNVKSCSHLGKQSGSSSNN